MSESRENSWSFYSNYGLLLLTVLPFALTYFFIEQRSRCFYYVFVILSIDACQSILKLASHQARPYWVSAEIRAFNCSN